MKKLNVHLCLMSGHRPLVGQLAEAERRVYFEYSPEFLHSGLWLSPFKLPLQGGLQEHKDRSFGPVFGLFDDSLPDGWGLLLMDRYFRRQGLSPASLSPLDRLAYLGTRTMGALTYHPPMTEDNEPALIDLHQLAEHSYDVLSGDSATILPVLQRAGGSPGGARPKVLVGVSGDTILSGEETLPEGYDYWLIKFHSSRESADDGRIEFAYSQMARKAGLNMPQTRLFMTNDGDAFFGVKRFDRHNGRRFHVHTFGNLIHANFRIPGCDYDMLMRVSMVLTKNHSEVLKHFRQMVFNVFSCNRDDHVKNFAFMLDETDSWVCTPAYDLTFSSGPGGEHTMTVSGEGRSPELKHLLQVAETAGIGGSEAKAVIADVAYAVTQWPDIAAEAGVSRNTAQAIASELADKRPK